MKQSWNIDYKKNKGQEKVAELYEKVEVIREYCNSRGFLAFVPDKKTEKDSGYRKFDYDGIVGMRLA